jgi:hypothetical protein
VPELLPARIVVDAARNFSRLTPERKAMLDRRRTPRLRSLKSGRIDFNPHWPQIDCIVRNVSDRGACIEMPGQFNTSLEFDLVFTTAQEKRACRQIWRRDNRLGVEYC